MVCLKAFPVRESEAFAFIGVYEEWIDSIGQPKMERRGYNHGVLVAFFVTIQCYKIQRTNK